MMVLLTVLPMMAQQVQGWPANYGGVMLQAFSWDSYDDTQWAVLESQADELAPYFSLVWIPQSSNSFAPGTDPSWKSMGYDDYYWFPGEDHYRSSFGTEDQLRSMIKTFKAKGIGTIADVVINHRKSQNGWFGFPTETYNGVTYSMSSKDVCSNDDGGKAKQNNPSAQLGKADTGEDWDGMRDLDHTSTNVQNTVKAYLGMLLNDLGYTGFRYDMVLGYGAQYTKMYNESSKPQYSVGELWSGTLPIKNWINATGKTSAAFDFQFKYVATNAAEKKNYRYLDQANGDYSGYPNYPLISNREEDGSYRQWAVTFIENHDTQLRPDGSSNGPVKCDTVSLNAYLLAMPGTPCVFLPHWNDCKQDIKSQILVRQLTGIVNTSSYEMILSNMRYFVTSTEGTKGKLLCYLGDQTRYTPEDNWVKVLEGYKYSYWVDRSANTAWISLASGTYKLKDDEQLSVLVSAVADPTAQLVVTTDGSEPTASSTTVASGSMITIPYGTTTVKVGLLINGAVSGVQTRTYTVKEPYTFKIPDFCKVNPGEVCAFFEAPLSWTTVKCWAWDSKNNYTGGAWPGAECTFLGVSEDNKNVWKWSYSGTLTTQPTMIIFNNNNNGSQTKDLNFQNAGYYSSTGELLGIVKEISTGICNIKSDSQVSRDNRIYNLSGQQITTPRRGIYIQNGKKFIK